MTEKQKWTVLAGLVAVLGVTVVLRFHHPRHSKVTHEKEARAAQPEVVAAVSGSSALQLAKAILGQPTVESVLPERDLFAPRSGRSRDTAGPRAERSGSGLTETGGKAEEPAAERSPDREPRVEPARVPSLTLTATFRDGVTRMALLGGTLVREGDRVAGGYVLSKVEENRVVLTRGGDVLVVGMSAK